MTPTAGLHPIDELTMPPERPILDAPGAATVAPAPAPITPDGAPDGGGGSPFGAPASPKRRVGTWLVFAGVLAGAAGAVFYATRGSEPAPMPAGHAHGGGAAETKASPVMLTAEGARRIGVTFAPVVREPLAGEVRTVGLVTYDETRVTTIAPKLDGWIERLDVNITGAPVRRGEPLFAIYSPMLVTAQEELVLAQRLAREVAAGTPDAARGALDLVESARRRLAYWDIPADEIAQLERTGQVRKALTLRAPVTGIVVEKNVLQGQRIMAGDPVYRIADLSVVWLEGEVFERDLAAMRLGQMVTAEFQALPGAPRRGRITYIYPTLNAETRTARVRVALPNGDGALKPGMYATIRVATQSPVPAVTVPRSAVLATGTRTLVFAKDAFGSLVPRDVVVGRATDTRVELLSGGVVPGDTVVASATFLIDAESNLGSALGGMGNMPGMDMAPPAGGAKAVPAPGEAPGRAPEAAPAMPNMPNMNMPATPGAAPARPAPAAPGRPSGAPPAGQGAHAGRGG